MRSTIKEIVFLFFLTACSTSCQTIDLSENIQLFLKNEGSFKVKLRVKNIGNESVFIPHFTSDLYENHGLWGGFSFLVTSPNDQHRFVNLGRFVNPKFDNYINLKPGDYFEGVFNLGDLVCMECLINDNEKIQLKDSTGEFVVQANFAIVKGGTVRYPNNIKVHLMGSTESNRINLVLD